ncbi:MAG TPA: FUSC family protein [Polyangiales bacterium]|nr:FUSC family protein [Polyangiales bacterium]
MRRGDDKFGLIRNSAIRREALRVAPGRPNLRTGLRAALATTAPLVAAGVLHRPELGLAGLAGFSVVLADKGGAYRSRALSMLAVTLCGALATAIGMLAGLHSVLSVLLIAMVVAAAGFMRLFGAEATSVGTMVAMATVVSLSRPAPSLSAAGLYALFYVVGGAWAALITLVFWPLRAYRPARVAIANALRALSGVAQSLIDADTSAAAQVERRKRLGEARSAIEVARAQLGSLRKGRIGSTSRGERLVGLVESADLVMGALVAIEDGLAFEPPEHLPELQRWIEQVAGFVESQLSEIAQALEGEKPLAPSMPRHSLLLAKAVRDAAESPDDHEPRILVRAVERVERMRELASGIDDPNAPALVDRAELSAPTTRASNLALLHDHLSLDSAVFRHVVRSTLATSATVLVVKLLALEHGYWATLTCLVILQPHGAQTWAKALQRVIGTVIGAGIALLIAAWANEAHLLVVSVFVFVAVAVALLPLNYGVFTVFLTPAFVLLAETQAGNVDVISERILNTGLGALIALLGSRLILPLSERDQIRPLLVAALSKLEQLIELAAQDQPAIGQVRAARRGLGMALLNAEASYQRLLTETGIPADQSQAVLTLLLSAHRIASGLIAIVFARGTPLHERLTERAADLQTAISTLREAIETKADPAPTPEPNEAPDPVERVEVLFEQLAVMRTAALRFNATPTS